MISPDAIKEAKYLGDGLYALWDGQDIALFTYDGPLVLDVVYLDPEVQAAFTRFMVDVLIGKTTPIKFE